MSGNEPRRSNETPQALGRLQPPNATSQALQPASFFSPPSGRSGNEPSLSKETLQALRRRQTPQRNLPGSSACQFPQRTLKSLVSSSRLSPTPCKHHIGSPHRSVTHPCTLGPTETQTQQLPLLEVTACTDYLVRVKL